MSQYVDVVKTEKKYIGNVVIQIGANYFAIRQPDSGLAIAAPFDRAVSSLLLNPTQIDLRKVSTTISTFSFRILDDDGVVTALILGDAAGVIGQEVRIFLGRSSESMDFAEYFELPRTFVRKCDHSDNSYNFSSSEQTERMAKPIYNFKSALNGGILAATTIFTMRDDISGFPTAGFLKIEDEFISYAGVDLGLNQFTGCIRGELGSTPAAHAINLDAVLVETITDNPLNIILKILISGGGGGPYDVLQSGLGISNTLIDVAGIETLRDELFLGDQYKLSLYSITSALKKMEDDLLMPNNLRFTTSTDSKVTLAILDKALFVEEDDVINEDTITKFPKWTIDGSKVTNQLEINWDFNEGTGLFQKRNIYTDPASITAYGEQTPLNFSFKGIKAALDGQTLVDDFSTRLLGRLSTPTPEIQLNVQIDKSLQTVGDKSFVESSLIPAANGTLNFASNLEILSRSINITSGDVQFKLAFTSFTNIRSGFIAPSDLVFTVISQNQITVAAGRGSYYSSGWAMRLWNETTQAFETDPVNFISDVTGDTITFLNNWTTVLGAGNHRMRFADYDDATASQKRYCFISDSGLDFADGGPTYKVTY